MQTLLPLLPKSLTHDDGRVVRTAIGDVCVPVCQPSTDIVRIIRRQFCDSIVLEGDAMHVVRVREI